MRSRRLLKTRNPEIILRKAGIASAIRSPFQDTHVFDQAFHEFQDTHVFDPTLSANVCVLESRLGGETGVTPESAREAAAAGAEAPLGLAKSRNASSRCNLAADVRIA